MNIDFMRGLATVVLLLAFIGIWAWAWSKNRKPTFDEASRMPLEEDQAHPPADGGTKE